MTFTFRETDVVTREVAYARKPRVYCGFRVSIRIQDQIGNPMEIYFDNSRQIEAFIKGFAEILQCGQTARFECVALGMHGWIRGKGREVRDRYGNRIMPRPGHPAFDALVKAFAISERARLELATWDKYSAHNQEWYHRQMQARMYDQTERVGA